MQLARYDWPAQEFAARTQEAGCPTWKYRFMWKAPDSVYDSCHTIELPFVFGTLKAWEKLRCYLGPLKKKCFVCKNDADVVDQILQRW